MSLSPTEMQLYNSLGTTTYETEKYISSARKLLLDFGDQMADQKRPQFLEGALDEYKTAASKGLGDKIIKFPNVQQRNGAIYLADLGAD